MRTFGTSGKEARELAEARKEIDRLNALLDAAREEASATERALREERATVRRLEIRLGDMKQGGEFVESHGVLWQRAASGLLEPLAYCPSCKLVMTPLPSGYPESLVCTSCTFKAPFHPEELPAIMAELAE